MKFITVIINVIPQKKKTLKKYLIDDVTLIFPRVILFYRKLFISMANKQKNEQKQKEINVGKTHKYKENLLMFSFVFRLENVILIFKIVKLIQMKMFS